MEVLKQRSDAMDGVGNGSGGAHGIADTRIALTEEVMVDTEVFDRESDTVTLESDARSDIVIDSMKFAEKQKRHLEHMEDGFKC